MEELTEELLKRLLPKNNKSYSSKEIVDLINSGATDNPDLANIFKENFLTYSNVLSEGKYKLTDYINAVKFVSLKMMEYSDIKAYAVVFPERYNRLKQEKKLSEEDISKYTHMYKKNDLVQQIYKQSIIPSYVLNAPLHQEALNILADTMRSKSISPMARIKAAETILEYTKVPEESKVKIDIGANSLNTIADLREATSALLATQKQMLQNGTLSLKEVAESNIIEVVEED